MKRIWKFGLSTNVITVLDIPEGYLITSVGLDPSNKPCIWAIVDPEAPTIKVRIRIVGTGEPLPEDCGVRNFMGAIIAKPYVWHIFDTTTVEDMTA